MFIYANLIESLKQISASSKLFLNKFKNAFNNTAYYIRSYYVFYSKLLGKYSKIFESIKKCKFLSKFSTYMLSILLCDIYKHFMNFLFSY